MLRGMDAPQTPLPYPEETNMICHHEGMSIRMMPMMSVSTKSEDDPTQNVWVWLNREDGCEWSHMTPEQRQAIKDAPPDAPWPFQSKLADHKQRPNNGPPTKRKQT